MNELVITNLRNRPLRTLISVVGVALGVVLVILFTGLARGMANDLTRRAANWKAEIVFTRPGGIETTSSSNISLSVKYVDRLQEIQGVQSATPIIRYVAPGEGKFGLTQLDGVNWNEFSQMNKMELLRGRAPQSDDEILLDERMAKEWKTDVGGTVKLFKDQPYKVAGVFSPPSGSRTKLTLSALQNILKVKDKCSYILVKIKDGEKAEDVAARINQELPGNKVVLSADLVVDAEQRFPALKTFLQALVGLGAFVCIIFVLLSMYTTVTERRREIGILKSLGASKSFIIGTIEREAFLIGVLGMILGFVISFLAAVTIQRVFELVFEFDLKWILVAVALAIGGSLVGALYPAWRASSLDPVLVLTNE
ncbi:MAG: ABC transporter permease [Pyrinomonadaceae bacterium]|nr:ABC transporter permease [Pyrinomonadaceae bacterium]